MLPRCATLADTRPRPQRHQTLPPAQTASAREALQSFYCSLCSKGYSRMNDYEAHLSSYDHSHKQRLKDMKAMVRDSNAGARARKAEAKADGLVTIKLSSSEPSAPGPGGFKKGGFKKSGFKSAFAPAEDQSATAPTSDPERNDPTRLERRGSAVDAQAESDTDDEGYEMYNPCRPTD